MFIQPHRRRPHKTRRREYVIPFLGVSLRAAHKIKQNVRGEYCLPHYTNNHRTNAISASAALNKWIKVLTKHKDNTIYGLRYVLDGRLRADDQGCSRRIIWCRIDFIEVTGRVC